MERYHVTATISCAVQSNHVCSCMFTRLVSWRVVPDIYKSLTKYPDLAVRPIAHETDSPLKYHYPYMFLRLLTHRRICFHIRRQLYMRKPVRGDEKEAFLRPRLSRMPVMRVKWPAHIAHTSIKTCFDKATLC